jgi:hypothetical protein
MNNEQILNSTSHIATFYIGKDFINKFRKILKEEEIGIRPIPWYAMRQTNK